MSLNIKHGWLTHDPICRLVAQEAIAKKLGILTGSGVALASAFEKRISSLQEHLNFGFWMVVLQLDGVMYKCVRGTLEGLLTQAEIPEASWGQEILYRQVSSWYVQSSREQDPILLHVAFPIPFKPATGQEFELLSDADKIKAQVVSVKRCQGCYW